MIYKYFLICSQQRRQSPLRASNLRTLVCEANALPLTTRQTASLTLAFRYFIRLEFLLQLISPALNYYDFGNLSMN